MCKVKFVAQVVQRLVHMGKPHVSGKVTAVPRPLNTKYIYASGPPRGELDTVLIQLS